MPMIAILRIRSPYRIGPADARSPGMAKSLMFMGTGSDVGKSLIVAGLCRAYANRGLKVAPFKPQNMSNNAGVTADGGEIGRAQMLQARAARRDPVTAMNPILLKPEHESGSQVVVRGKRVGSMPAREYWRKRGEFLPQVLAAYEELAADADLVLAEGAGSASEINLRHNDIANFGFARAENLPVVLIGDIQRGGVIASLVGTFAVIEPDDAALIAATLVNKFEGDPTLFEGGKRTIAERTGVPCLGPVPMFRDARKLPAEDILGLESTTGTGTGTFRIVVPRLPRIANFDDLDPLRLEPGVSVEIVEPGRQLPPADLIILPGSKATRADLRALVAQCWDRDILRHRRYGGAILGICGGYQMLGNTIADPDGIEGEPGESRALGLLDVDTVLAPSKDLRVGTGRAANGAEISGYHMHMGVTQGGDRRRPFATVAGAPEGAISPDKKVMGTYLHGLFAANAFRGAFLSGLGTKADPNQKYESGIDEVLDRLAAHLEQHLDLDALLALARSPTRT
jgi:adenosylcobyric acid synthase